MKKQFILPIAFLLFALCTQATIIKYEKGVAWASSRDLTSAEFSKKFKQYKDAGYLMIDVDVYQVGSKTRYAMVWRKNTDRRGWAEYRDMTSDQYNKRWTEFKNKGYRPVDIESYRVNGKQRYAGIWVQNKEKLGWSSKRNLTGKQYGDYFQEQKKRGYRLVDMEAYQTSSGLRYSAIWVQNKEKVGWMQLRNMSREKYQSEVNKQSKKGFRIVDFESYRSGNKQLYAAIWEKRSGYGWQTRTNRSKTQFANLWREYRDKGYRLVDFECYKTSKGMRYGGVWIENSSRYRYNKKGKIDKLISDYRKANNLPGISVAIVKDGKMIYRRGFGYADTGKKKVAHGETVYSAASISKVIGGTIAVKMHAEKKLRNGKRVNLNLNNKTSSYLTGVKNSKGKKVSIPSKHKHTVAQLTSHLGCIEHYDGPEPSTKQYNRAIDALPQIWNAKFVDDCEVGKDRNYSTHAWTYIAAVLEQVSGRSAASLVRTELAQPYGLSTMRALYTSASVPSNYDRAVPYKNNNKPTKTGNNSWKIFGGGIEVSPVDLAWFGWKVLDGKIVKASDRDNILWKRVKSNRTNGIGWEIRTRDSKRVAEHGGSWTGALTRLRVYRDDGLVIAIMSNRRNHTSGNLSTLASDIADEVL